MNRNPRLANILLREMAEEEDMPITKCPNCGAENIRREYKHPVSYIFTTQECYHCKYQWIPQPKIDD